MTKTPSQLDAEIAAREKLVRLAWSVGASLFTGKRTLSLALIEKAQSAAFYAILRADPQAGTSHSKIAPHAHDVSALAAQGVGNARRAWLAGTGRRK